MTKQSASTLLNPGSSPSLHCLKYNDDEAEKEKKKKAQTAAEALIWYQHSSSISGLCVRTRRKRYRSPLACELFAVVPAPHFEVPLLRNRAVIARSTTSYANSGAQNNTSPAKGFHHTPVPGLDFDSKRLDHLSLGASTISSSLSTASTSLSSCTPTSFWKATGTEAGNRHNSQESSSRRTPNNYAFL
jgi:hypothetical protein